METEHARLLAESSKAKERASVALSEAEGTAQVATWEAKSLREELNKSRERSEELSSALEEARDRESVAKRAAEAALREELEGLRKAAREAEEGLGRMKDKRKRDLQVRRRAAGSV